jgi:hypothetical protein
MRDSKRWVRCLIAMYRQSQEERVMQSKVRKPLFDRPRSFRVLRSTLPHLRVRDVLDNCRERGHDAASD